MRKVPSRVLCRLLWNVCPAVISGSQIGFRFGRETTEMIFLARQVQKCIKQRVPLFQVFVDLTKAFDTAIWDALWTMLGKIFANMLKQLERGMKARDAISSRLPQDIPVDTAVKQGDILTPKLFSIFFGDADSDLSALWEGSYFRIHNCKLIFFFTWEGSTLIQKFSHTD